jgi:hypothetical protein
VRYVFDIKEDCNGKERYKPEEIVPKLRQVDVLVSQGQNMVEAIRQIGVSEVVSMPALSMGAARKSAFSSYLKSPREEVLPRFARRKLRMDKATRQLRPGNLLAPPEGFCVRRADARLHR